MSDVELRAALLASDDLLRTAEHAARKLRVELMRGTRMDWREVEQLLNALDDGDFKRALERNRVVLETMT